MNPYQSLFDSYESDEEKPEAVSYFEVELVCPYCQHWMARQNEECCGERHATHYYRNTHTNELLSPSQYTDFIENDYKPTELYLGD